MATIREQLTQAGELDSVQYGEITLYLRPLTAGEVAAWAHADDVETSNMRLLALALVDADRNQVFEDTNDLATNVQGLIFTRLWDAVGDIVLERNFPEKKS